MIELFPDVVLSNLISSNIVAVKLFFCVFNIF